MPDHLLQKKPGTEPLFEALRACRVHFVWAAVFSALVNLLYLTPTLYMMQVYDRVVPTGGLTTLVLITAAAVLALGSLSTLDWLRGRLMLRAGLRLDRLLADKVLGRVVDIQGKTPSTQALREFDSVRSAIAGPGTLALFDAPWTPIYLGCCFLLHPAIGVLTLVGGAILFTLAWLNERESRPRLDHAMQTQNQAYASQEAVAAQAEVVRALGMRRASIARQIVQRRQATAAQADAQLVGGRYSGAIKFLRLLLQSASLGLAAFLAVKGDISAGAIIASSVLLSRAVAPIEMLVGAWPGIVQGRAGWKTLNDLFAGTAAIDRERTTLPDPKGRLQIEAVMVKYLEAEPPQLRAAALSLAPGEVVGVVGPSGSGKTTLARVVAGAIKPQSGIVRLDGAEYDAREGDELARWIGYLPQVPSLFAGSIKENISRFAAATGAPTEHVDAAAVKAAKAAGAHDLIQRLPKGYDTVLGPYGQGLSAGQAQRIALARALYDEPVLLVLDEPNSNLDQDGEAALMQAIIDASARGAAVLIVAHRAGVLARADRLVVLREGMIHLDGPRDEVMSKLAPARAPATPASRPAAAPKAEIARIVQPARPKGRVQ